MPEEETVLTITATDPQTPFEPPPQTPKPDAPYMPPDPTADPDVPEKPVPDNVPDLPDRPQEEPLEPDRSLGSDDDDPIYPEDPPIEEPDPLDPPIEEPPPGWGA